MHFEHSNVKFTVVHVHLNVNMIGVTSTEYLTVNKRRYYKHLMLIELYYYQTFFNG